MMTFYFVNGSGRMLIGSGFNWDIYNNDNQIIGSGHTILTAILAADFDSLDYAKAHMIETVILKGE